jgi:hypothetical protein
MVQQAQDKRSRSFSSKNDLVLHKAAEFKFPQAYAVDICQRLFAEGRFAFEP